MNFEYLVFTAIIAAVLIFVFTGGKSQNRDTKEVSDGIERTASTIARQKKARKMKAKYEKKDLLKFLVFTSEGVVCFNKTLMNLKLLLK